MGWVKDSFNRTIIELKLDEYREENRRCSTFNRTIIELKRKIMAYQSKVFSNF